MKKTFALLLLVALSLSSCENDDDDFIVGEWKVKKVLINGNPVSLIECDETTVYDFRSNQEFRIYGSSITSDGYVCMLHGVVRWEKSDVEAYILRYNNSDAPIAAEVVKVSKDTIVLQNIEDYPSELKKILVRL